MPISSYSQPICSRRGHEEAKNICHPEICLHILYTVYTPASGRVGRVADCGVRGLGFKSRSWFLLLELRNQFSITTSGQQWWRPILIIVMSVKKGSYGGVFDLAVEPHAHYQKTTIKLKKIVKYNTYLLYIL